MDGVYVKSTQHGELEGNPPPHSLLDGRHGCVCVRARVCVRACVCVCVGGGGHQFQWYIQLNVNLRGAASNSCHVERRMCVSLHARVYVVCICGGHLCACCVRARKVAVNDV